MLQKYREELSLQPTRDCNARASFLDEEVGCDRNGSFQSAKMLTEKNRSHEVGRSQSSAKSRKLRWLPTSPSGNGRTSMLEVCMYVINKCPNLSRISNTPSSLMPGPVAVICHTYPNYYLVYLFDVHRKSSQRARILNKCWRYVCHFYSLLPKPLKDLKVDSSLMPGPVEANCHTYPSFS